MFINLSGEYFKFAFVKRRITPVLKKEAMKILFIMAPVVKDLVSRPIRLMRFIFKVRIIMFHTEIKIVTEFPKTKF